MTTDPSIVSYYAARAREYEHVYDKPERQDDLRWLRDFVGHAFAGTRVLELACGTGYWTEILARSAAFVLATDILPEVLTVAHRKGLDPGKVEFHLADAYTLPPFANPFTAAFSGFWWSHIPTSRLHTFLQSFHGALSPGSRVVFIDNVYVVGSSTPISRTDQNGDTYQFRHLENGSRYEVLKNFPTASELNAAVRDFALDVQTVFLRYYWVLTYVTKGEPRSRCSAGKEPREGSAALPSKPG